MELKPVNKINSDANTIRVSDGNSPIRLIFKDAKGEVINLYDKIDYFYLTKDDETFFSVTDISYEGDEVIFRLPKLRKGQYKAEIRDKDGSIYPANEDLYILLRRSFEDDKDIYYFGHREDILNSVEPIIIQHIEENPNKFKGERGQQGFPGRDGLRGKDGKDGKDGDQGIQGMKGDKGDQGIRGIQGIQGIKGDKGDKGDKGNPGVNGKDFDKNNFLVDQTMITDELKQQIAGTAEINAIPADNSLTTNKFVDKAVTPNKTSFLKLSNNLLNPQEITLNTTVNAEGNEVTSSIKWVSDFIPVLSNDELSITERAPTESSHGLFYYDENKAYLTQSVTSTNGFTVPNYSPIQYVRISSESNPNKIMMNEGNTLLKHEPYSPKIESEMLPSADGDIVNIEYNDVGRLVAISEKNSYGEFKTTKLNYDGDTLSTIVEEDFSRSGTVQSNLIYDNGGKLISIQNT